MKLREKALLALSSTLILFVVALFFLSRFVFLRSYALLDAHNAGAHVGLVMKTLSEITSSLDSKAGDWANWDDTYDFIETTDPEFIRTNPTNKTFSELQINLMLFIHSSGRVVFRKAFDLQTQREIAFPKGFSKHIAAGSRLLRHSNPSSRHSGLILLPEKTLMISSRPILTSEGKGPARGTLIFGRYLDEVVIRKLTEEAHYSLSVYRIDDTHMPQDISSAIPLITENAPVYIIPLSAEIIGGYTVLRDVYGNPALIVKLALNRDIYRQGQKTVLYFIVLALVLGLILGAVTLFILEKLILSRVSKLGEHAREVGTSGDLSRRIAIKGNDELSRLADEMNKMLEALEKSEENYRNLFENANDLIQSVDAEGRFLNINKKWRTMLGYTVDEARQLYFTDIIRKDHVPDCMEMLQKISTGESVDSAETVFISKDGREVYVEGSINAQRINGQFVCTRGIFRDITLRKEIERALKESEEKFRAISNAAKDAVIMMDDDGNITFWNRAAETIFGYTNEEIMGKELHAILAPGHYLESYRKGLEAFKSTGKGHAVGRTTELTGLRKGGVGFPLELSLSSVPLNNRWHAVGIVRDVTARKNMEARLREMSYRDELTGLYNRRGFIELAEQQMKIAGRMQRGMLLLFADMDGMKQINDQYGHQEGDRALRETADILRKTFRESDIVARIGGDEFVALTLETKTENAGILHDRLIQYLSDRNARGDLPYGVSLSIGITYYDHNRPETIEKLLARGDTLMYEEKKKRKGAADIL